jgi:hypothetical protein
MWLEIDKAKENQSARKLQGKQGVGQKGEMRNKGSKEGGQQIKVQDKIPSESPQERC